MNQFKAFLAASLAVPDGAAGEVQGMNFGFYYVVGATETVVDPSITTLDAALNWLSVTANIELHDSYVIQLDADEVVQSRKTLALQDKNKAVTIRIRRYNAASSNSAIITLASGIPEGMLEVGQGLTLSLDSKITVSGTGSTALKDYTGFILVQGGTLNMLPNSKITGVTVPNEGGAVVVGSLTFTEDMLSTFNMAGEISGNYAGANERPGTAPASHGAVFVRANGKVTMSGGSITNNTRGVVIGGRDAEFTMSGGSITDNGKVDPQPPDPTKPRGLRGAGVCVGLNQMAGIFNWNGGSINGNGKNDAAGALDTPGGELYVSSSTGVLTLNKPSNMGLSGTVCLTNTNQSRYPALILGPNFTNNLGDDPITLDLASTRPEWIPSWVGKTVLKLGAGSTSSIAALKGRFVLGKFYESSGNKDFVPDTNISPHVINDNGVLQ
jgi:hypothetical protein